MPLYEYRCNACKRMVSVLTRSYAPPAQVTCEHCGSTDLRRSLSRVAVLRSEESRLDSLADSVAQAGLSDSDPRSVGRWMRQMGPEFRDDLGPEFDQIVDRMEAGEVPGEEENGETDLGEDEL